MKKAPWPDFAGNDIHEGDTIRHPSGETGKVVYMALSNEWRVDYGEPTLSLLSLQIGEKGQAVVVTQPSPDSSLLDDECISELLDEAGLVLIPVMGNSMYGDDGRERPESPIAIDEELWEFARLVEAEVRERLAKLAEAGNGSLTAAEIRGQETE